MSEDKYSPSAIARLKQEQLYKELSFEQKTLFDQIVFQRRNAFFTGQAGAGKSHLTRCIIKFLIALLSKECVCVASMTGIAAVNIQGVTLHSAVSAAVLSDDEALFNDVSKLEQQMFKRVHQQPQTREKILKYKVLIIDEVSMLTNYFFDALNLMMQKIHKSFLFFGGVQIVLCGDFMQLPPISKLQKSVYLFQSLPFQNNIEIKCQLVKQFRQQNDLHFLNILNKIRNNNIDDEVHEALGQKSVTEASVDLQQTQITIKAQNQFQLSQKEKLAFFQNKRQLIFKNLDEKKDVSVEIRIITIRQNLQLLRQLKECEFQYKTAQFTPMRFPIRLYSKNEKVTNFNNRQLQNNNKQIYKISAFETGQPDYLKSIERPEKLLTICEGAQIMIIRNIDLSQNLANGTVGVIRKIKFFSQKQSNILEVLQDKVVLEVVIKDFQGNDVIKQIVPQKIEQSDKQGKVVATRIQLPVVLAYAISIHKSQGITLEKAVVSMDGIFEAGQAYVALSRLTSLDGLQLINYSRNLIKADEACMRFQNSVVNLHLGSDIFVKNNLLQCKKSIVNKKYLFKQNKLKQIFKEYEIEEKLKINDEDEYMSSNSSYDQKLDQQSEQDDLSSEKNNQEEQQENEQQKQLQEQNNQQEDNLNNNNKLEQQLNILDQNLQFNNKVQLTQNKEQMSQTIQLNNDVIDISTTNEENAQVTEQLPPKQIRIIKLNSHKHAVSQQNVLQQNNDIPIPVKESIQVIEVPKFFYDINKYMPYLNQYLNDNIH